ncbi:hypothetical protein ACFLZ1_00465 [Patescibacteria group bacterium]
MAPANPKPPKTETGKQIKSAKELPLLDYNSAKLIVDQLIKDPKANKITFSPFYAPISRELSKQALINLLQNDQELVNQLRIKLGPIPIPSSSQIETLPFLKAFQETVIQTSPGEIEKEEQFLTTTPSSDQLKRWQEELRLWQQEHQKAVKKAEIEIPDFPTLKEQIDLIQKRQGQIENAIRLKLDKELDYLSEAEKQQVLARMGEHCFRDIIAETQAVVAKGGNLEAELKKRITPDFIYNSLSNLSDQDTTINLVIAPKHKRELSQTLSQITPENPEKTAKAYEEVIKTRAAMAPTRKELVSMFKKDFGLSIKEATEIVDKLDLSQKHPFPTTLEAQQLLEDHLPPKTVEKITKEGLTVSQVSSQYSQQVANYQHYQGLTLAQPAKGYYRPISKEAIRLFKKLKLDIEISTIENFLRGFTLPKINSEIARLKPDGLGGLIPSNFLKKFKQEFETLEDAAKTSLPKSFVLHIEKVRLRARLLETAEKVNPLNFSLFNLQMPKTHDYNNLGFKLISKQWDFLTKRGPINSLRQRFQTFRETELRFFKFRWQSWLKFKDKFTTSSGPKRFWSFFPSKLKPSHWARPAYWLRRGVGRSTFWIGKQLGSRMLMRSGALLHKYAFKELFKKGATKLLLKLGLGATGVGTVFAIAGAIKDTLKFLFDKDSQEAVKKLVQEGGKVALGGAIGTVAIVAQYPLVFVLGTIGFIIGGPIGALIGGSAGLAIHKALAFLGGSQGLFSFLGGTGASISGFFSSVAGSLSSVTAIGTASAFGVGGAVGLTFFSTWMIQENITNSAFFTKPDSLAEITPAIKSEYLVVNKTASPSRVESENLPATITYTVTVTATKKDITITAITDEFTVYPGGQNLISSIEFSEPLQVTAGQTVTLPAYDMAFDSSYNNSTISNQIVVTAEVVDGPTNEQASAEAAVIIGKPETMCFVFEDGDVPWENYEQADYTQAISYLQQWPYFESLLCDRGTITLKRMAGSEYGGWARCSLNEIVIYDRGAQNGYLNALYTLTHESGHFIDCRNGDMRDKYRQVVDVNSEGYLPTYPLGKTESEDFAETIGIYPIWDKITFRPERGGSINYPVDYPTHYLFADSCVFHDQCPN